MESEQANLQETAKYHQGFGWLINEGAVEGSYNGEQAMPETTTQNHTSSPGYCSPVYTEYSNLQGPQVSTEDSASSSYTGSLEYIALPPHDCCSDKEDERHGLDKSFGFLVDSLHDSGFLGSHDNMEEDEEDTEGDNSPSRVLKQLDQIMRKKINLELQEFHGSLHSILDGQIGRINQLFRLSQGTEESKKKKFCQSPLVEDIDTNRTYATDTASEVNKSQSTQEDRNPMESEVAIYESLTSLFISVGEISRTLRRKEFSL